MTTIAAQHKEWAAKVMPDGAPQVQRAEMERAFYSGFFAALNWQLTHLADLPEDKAVLELEAAHSECVAYFRTLGKATVDISRQ